MIPQLLYEVGYVSPHSSSKRSGLLPSQSVTHSLFQSVCHSITSFLIPVWSTNGLQLLHMILQLLSEVGYVSQSLSLSVCMPQHNLFSLPVWSTNGLQLFHMILQLRYEVGLLAALVHLGVQLPSNLLKRTQLVYQIKCFSPFFKTIWSHFV